MKDGEKQPKTLGRAYLVEKLRDCGLSRRPAVRALNAIFEEMKGALARGGEVEFPFGKLRRVERHFNRFWDQVNDWPANRQRYTVELELNQAGERLLNGPEAGGKPTGKVVSK